VCETINCWSKERRILSTSLSSIRGGDAGLRDWTKHAKYDRSSIDENDDEYYNDNDDDNIIAQYNISREGAIKRNIRNSSSECSAVSIVTLRQEDLENISTNHHHHHDHESSSRCYEQQVLKCRISTEWNNNGTYISFADRAMIDWKRAWYSNSSCSNDSDNSGGSTTMLGENMIVEKGGNMFSSSSSSSLIMHHLSGWCTTNNCSSTNSSNARPKVSRRENKVVKKMDSNHEPISSIMVVIFLSIVVAQFWNMYGL
jgi:hypothetical protein